MSNKNRSRSTPASAIRRVLAAWTGSADGATLAELRAQLAALDRSQALIELDLQGNILDCNANFLRILGYRLEEVRGHSHRMLVEEQPGKGEEYRQLWEALRRGEHHSGQYRHVAKGGRQVWLQVSYSPVLDAEGRPSKVLVLASELSGQASFAQQMQGTVARTQEVVKAAVGGDLSRRLDTAGISGDVLEMAEAINLLLSAVAGMFTEMQAIVLGAAEGDLSGRLNAGNKTGELRKTAESVNLLIDGFADIVSNVKTAAGEVLRGAEEISQGNLNLSSRTEEQSSSLEETASSMEEMTSTVKQNADNAGQANQLATAARDQAEKGGTVVGKAVAAMAKINEASKKISDIIGVIDEIAFQTNLLALNAAVEAARAGEQGRGFAVVATEVRSLAGRSATAAKEIKELIQDSVRKVEDGSTLVTQSGQTLDQIVTSVKKVSDIVAEIAAASREQSAGIEQVNHAVTQMDEMTQQNAALVEQATAASQSMAEQARQLSALMQRYASGGAAIPEPVHSRPPGAVPKSRAKERVSPGERRSTARPWTGKSQPQVPVPAPSAATQAPTPPPKAAGGTDTEWVEF